LQQVNRDSRILFCSDNEVQRRHFFGSCKGQKIEEHVVTELVLRNNENRPSLTSGAEQVTERQEASSKHTMYRKHDR